MLYIHLFRRQRHGFSRGFEKNAGLLSSKDCLPEPGDPAHQTCQDFAPRNCSLFYFEGGSIEGEVRASGRSATRSTEIVSDIFANKPKKRRTYAGEGLRPLAGGHSTTTFGDATHCPRTWHRSEGLHPSQGQGPGPGPPTPSTLPTQDRLHPSRLRPRLRPPTLPTQDRLQYT